MKSMFNASSVIISFATAVTVVGCAHSTEDGHDARTSEAALDTNDTPDASQVSVKVSAEGCGPYASGVSTDNSSFSVLFEEASAVVQNNSVTSLDCRVSLQYAFPSGWTFDAPSAIARMYGSLNEGASAELRLSTSLGAGTASTSRTLNSSMHDDFLLDISTASAAAQAGSVPCGATSATVSTRLTITPSSAGEAYVRMDALDGALTWRRCTQAGGWIDMTNNPLACDNHAGVACGWSPTNNGAGYTCGKRHPEWAHSWTCER
jgi:hypothetical protein